VIAHLTAGGKLDMQIKVKKAVAMCQVTCVVCPKTPTKPSAASFWMRRSRLCVAFPTPWNRPVWNSVPIWKLIINIETNGVISPEEAIRQSARVLVDQLNVFAALEGTEAAAKHHRAHRWSILSCCVQWTIWN
jgi:DNA-directed RNA polymerase subunit alpha